MNGSTIRTANRLALFLAIGAGSIASAATTDVSTADVLNKLHRSNQNEIAMGKLAEKNGQSREVKSYGQMLVKDHEAADKKVVALASEEKLTLQEVPSLKGTTPGTMPGTTKGTAKHEMKDGMGSIPEGPGFDAKFAQEMVDDHKKDIAEVTRARDDTSDPKLKKLLNQLLPTLEKHEQTAQKILDSQSKSASR